jgi:lipoprotein-releasing system ATP-binding protein
MIAGLSRRESDKHAAALLAEFGLNSRLHHLPGKLSGGEQQRVAIARALANRPKVLLADEPTGNLDVETADAVFAQLVSRVREAGVAALIATHNPELAARMDRTVRIHDGRIVDYA